VSSSPSSSRPLRIGLTPGGTVIVHSQLLTPRTARFIGANGEEHVSCWCNRISAFRLEGSLTRLEHIAPGSYTLVVEDPEYGPQGYSLEVYEGESVELDVH
jgi:hypothetical protein